MKVPYWVSVAFTACLFVLGQVKANDATSHGRTLCADAAERSDWKTLDRALAKGADVNATQADGMTALHWSVRHASRESVRKLLNAGADAKCSTRYGITPLMLACLNGDVESAKLLLAAGANANDVQASGETVLMTAAKVGSVELVRLLVERGAGVNATERNDQTALMWGAHEGHADVVSELLKSGANRDQSLDSGFSAFFFAARQGHRDVLEVLLDDGADVQAVMKPQNTQGRAPRKGMSALMLALESGHFELALWLVDRGADPNDVRSGFSPLHAISWVRKANRGDGVDGDPEPRGSGRVSSLQFVRELAERGADVHLKLETGKSGRAKLNPIGATPMLFAAKTADLPLMQVLVELGADPLAANEDGCTPLMAAAGIGVVAVDEEAGTESEVLQTLEFLLSHGASVNTVDKNGETAMHGAAYRSFPKVADWLAEQGADPKVWNHKNEYGWTPLRIAEGYRPGSFKPSPPMIEAITQAAELR